MPAALAAAPPAINWRRVAWIAITAVTPDLPLQNDLKRTGQFHNTQVDATRCFSVPKIFPAVARQGNAADALTQAIVTAGMEFWPGGDMAHAGFLSAGPAYLIIGSRSAIHKTPRGAILAPKPFYCV